MGNRLTEAQRDPNEVIDALIAKHPDKARQALEKPVLQGWFAGKVMKEFNGYGDFGGICQMVAARLEAGRAALAQEGGGDGK